MPVQPRFSQPSRSGRRPRAAGVLLALLLALLLPLVLAGCAALEYEPPDVGLADVKLLSAGAFEQKVEAELSLTNLNDKPMILDGLSLELGINDAGLARGVSSERIEVPRLSTARVRVPFTANTLQMLQGLLQGVGREGFGYSLTGHVFVILDGSRHKVPVSKRGSILGKSGS
jgi:LEA14-like dessication related protein